MGNESPRNRRLCPPGFYLNREMMIWVLNADRRQRPSRQAVGKVGTFGTASGRRQRWHQSWIGRLVARAVGFRRGTFLGLCLVSVSQHVEVGARMLAIATRQSRLGQRIGSAAAGCFQL